MTVAFSHTGKYGLEKESRAGYSIGLVILLTGEHTFGLKKMKDTYLMLLIIYVEWDGHLGIELSESIKSKLVMSYFLMFQETYEIYLLLIKIFNSLTNQI